jgi:chromosome segregation ATPase
MGLHAIEAAPKDGNPVFPVDQDTGDTTIVHWAVRQGVALQREGVPIAVSSTHWRPGSKSVEGSRKSGSFVARASVAAGACILWLFVGAVEDKALCSESNAHANAFVAPTEKAKKTAQPRAMRDESSLVSPIIETTVVEQTQSFERGRENIDILADRLISIQRSDAAHGKAAQAVQSAPAWERKQPLQFGQEWGKAEVLGCALTSSLRAELDAVRSAAEAARIEQKQALDQERDRTNALARELSSLWAELDAARFVGLEAVRAAEAEQALEQERGRADDLARELTSLQAELGTARAAGSQAAEAESKQRRALEQERDGLARELTSLRGELAAAQAAGSQAAETESKQKQTLEQALGQERDKREALARELTSLRAELDTVRAAGSQAAEAESKQKQILERERGRADGLARELAALQTELGAVRAAGPEATQAAEAESKQRRAFEQERDGLARELTSLRGELAAAQAAGSQAAETESKQKQTLDQALGQERDKREALARELTSLKAELDTMRAAHLETALTAEAAKIEQQKALKKEREKFEALSHELASARKEAEERSARLAAAHAEELRVTETNSTIAAEHKLALANERDRADSLARELTSVKNELEASDREIATLRALRAPPSRGSVAESSQERIAESSSRTIDRKGRSPEQISGNAAALDRQRTELAAEIEKLRQQATADRTELAQLRAQVSEAARAPPPDAAALDRQRAELVAQIEKLRREATDNHAGLDRLEKQFGEAFHAPPRAANTPPSILQPQESPQSTATIGTSPDIGLPPDTTPRVILRFAHNRDSARTRAATLERSLRAQGLDVVKSGDSPASSRANEVMYFYNEDRPSAERIAAGLAEAALIQRPFADDGSLPRPGTIEVAIGR